MIAYLNGKITYKSPTHLYLDIGGLAYHVNISLHTFAAIENLDETKLYTYQHFTESDQSLYGFATEDEKMLFIHLISVSGIGPNTARMVTSYMTPSEARTAIIQENVSVINKVKGIGPKTAKRMILDLKDKLIKLELSEGGSSSLSTVTPAIGVREEALSALVSLGFVKSKVIKVIDKTLTTCEDELSVEALIKQVLRQLS